MSFALRLLASVTALALLGCAEPAPAPVQSVVTDDLGREVPFEAPAERVLTLAPNLTEILFTIGAGGTLVGASQADDYPPAVDTLPRYGTYPLDVEAVVALQPDLVLATDQVNNPNDARALTAAGIPTYYFSFDAVDDVPRALRTVGELVGREPEAEAAADTFEARIRRLAAQTDTLVHPRTLLLIGDETPFAFGDDSYTQELITIAGGESVTERFEGEAVTLSEEFVLEAAPDVIVGAFGEDYEPARLAELHPAWGPVPAIASGRVFGIDPDLLLRPGPRLADGAEALARLLHPTSDAAEVSGPHDEEPAARSPEAPEPRP